jgi:hypothetical protein
MKRQLLSVSALALLNACAAHAPPAVETAKNLDNLPVVLPDAQPEPIALRQPGDFVVYRFTGSYRKEPVTLTQRVIDRSFDTLLVDVTIEDGKKTKRLRLRIDDTVKSGGELLSVAELDGNVQRPFGVPAFEKLMGELVLGADENQGMIDSRPITVHLPNGEIACTRTSYKVKVGKREAVMRTVAAEKFAWGDVGGEITTLDGKVLYKAEIIDIGGAATSLQNGDEVYGELEEME